MIPLRCFPLKSLLQISLVNEKNAAASVGWCLYCTLTLCVLVPLSPLNAENPITSPARAFPSWSEVVADAVTQPPPALCQESLGPQSFAVTCLPEAEGRLEAGQPIPLTVRVSYRGSCPLLQIYPRATSEVYFRVEPCSPGTKPPIPSVLENERRKWEQYLETGLLVAEPYHGLSTFTRGTVFAGDSLTTEAVYRAHVYSRYQEGTQVHWVADNEGRTFALDTERWYWAAIRDQGPYRRGLALVQTEKVLHLDLQQYFRLEQGCYKIQAVFCAYPKTHFDKPTAPIAHPLEFPSEWIEIEVATPPQGSTKSSIPRWQDVVRDATNVHPPPLLDHALTPTSFAVNLEGPSPPLQASDQLRMQVTIDFRGKEQLLQVFPQEFDMLYFRLAPQGGGAMPQAGRIEAERLTEAERRSRTPRVEPLHGVETMTRGLVFSGDTMTTEAVYRSFVYSRYMACKSVPVLHPDANGVWEEEDWSQSCAANAEQWFRAGVGTGRWTGLRLASSSFQVVADLRDYFLMTDPGVYRVQAVFCAYPNTRFDNITAPITDPIEYTSEWIEIEVTDRPGEGEGGASQPREENWE
ncbi:MAG: hypothetical protein PWP23_977 [Candidatus Sumerlaeota bacterium]|nr:hypothetical protein [Candidatus Sumerlaeota bacterium]